MAIPDVLKPVLRTRDADCTLGLSHQVFSDAVLKRFMPFASLQTEYHVRLAEMFALGLTDLHYEDLGKGVFDPAVRLTDLASRSATEVIFHRKMADPSHVTAVKTLIDLHFIELRLLMGTVWALKNELADAAESLSDDLTREEVIDCLDFVVQNEQLLIERPHLTVQTAFNLPPHRFPAAAARRLLATAAERRPVVECVQRPYADRKIMTLRGHGAAVTFVEFSSDDK